MKRKWAGIHRDRAVFRTGDGHGEYVVRVVCGDWVGYPNSTPGQHFDPPFTRARDAALAVLTHPTCSRKVGGA